MQARLVAPLSLLALLAAASPARAATLPFTSTLSIQVASLASWVVSGSGVATLNGSSGAGHLTALALPSSPWATSGAIADYTDPSVFPIAGLKVTMHNGAGSFTSSGGIMPLLGTAKICLYGACDSTTNISNLSIPLTLVGQGGITIVRGAVNLTIGGSPWTVGTAAVGTLTVMGGLAPLSNTAAPSGMVILVSPFFVATHIGAFSLIPGVATLTLQFVPEPGTLALLATGIGGLVLLGRGCGRS
jgi:hypothetical protein